MKEFKEMREALPKVTVKIYGEEYIIKGESSPNYMEMLAGYVDKKMKQIGQRNPQLPMAKVAVLAAVNIADELSKLQEDYDQLVKMIEEEKSTRQ